MVDAQDPAVPAAQALVQVPPVAPVDVANPQQNPAPLQVQITFNLLVRLLQFFPGWSSPFRVSLFSFLPRGRFIVFHVYVSTIFGSTVPSFFL